MAILSSAVAVRQVVQDMNQGSVLNGAKDGATLKIHTQKARMVAAAPALWEVMIEFGIAARAVSRRLMVGSLHADVLKVCGEFGYPSANPTIMRWPLQAYDCASLGTARWRRLGVT